MTVFAGRIGGFLPTVVEAPFHNPATGASPDRMKGREKFRKSNSLSLWFRPGRRGKARATHGMVALLLRRQCADHSTDHSVILGKRSPAHTMCQSLTMLPRLTVCVRCRRKSLTPSPLKSPAP